MGQFRIDLPDGRSVMVDAANAQEAADGADVWANHGRTPQMQRAIADAVPIKPGAGGMMRSIVNGLTFNAAPEFDAAINAGMTGIKNAVAHATGQPDAGYGMADAFKAAQLVERGAGEKFAAEHPLLNVGGSLTGAILNPVNVAGGKFITGAPTLGGAVLRSGLVGAGTGAAYGAGGAKPGQRGAGALAGGVTGGVIGAAAPPLLAGVGALAGKLKDAAGDVAQGSRNLINPSDPEAAAAPADTEAAVGKLFDLARSKGIDIPTLTDPTGKGMTTAEAIGRPGVVSLGALGRRSGTTPDLLEPILRDRAQGAPQRILDDFASVSGIHPDEAAGDIGALTSRLQKEARPLYEAALSNPEPVWNTDLAKLAERPAIKDAINAAGKSLLNAGKDPTAVGLQIDPDTGAFVLNTDLSKATGSYPTAEAWDKVKKMVGALVQRDSVTDRAITTGEIGIKNRDYQAAAADLTKALAGDPAHGEPGAIPGYRAALDKAGDYLGLQSAFDRSQKMVLNPNVSAKDFAAAYSGLDEPSQAAFKAGIASKLSDQMQRGRLTPRQLTLPHVQGKLSAVLGDEAASGFLTRLQSEAQLAATGGRMMPGVNSPSMEYLDARAEQDAPMRGAGMVLKALRRPGATLMDMYDAGQSRVGSPQVRNELGRLLMQPPEATSDELFWHSMTPPKPPMLPSRLPYAAASGVAGSYAGQRK